MANRKKGSVKDFEFMGKLGTGSFGVVYKVRRKGNLGDNKIKWTWGCMC